jgi:hypothetical protein
MLPRLAWNSRTQVILLLQSPQWLELQGMLQAEIGYSTHPPTQLWWDWGVNFVFAKQVLYHLSHTCSPFCSEYFVDGVSNYFPRLASNCDPLDLSLPSS